VTEPADPARWVRACATGDVADGEGLRIATDPPVAVFRDGDALFCADSTCTHDRFSLADGAVEDCAVECPAHAARFDLRTGAGTPPARGSVAVHAVRVDGDDVLVALPASYTVDDTGR
jgi:3-phenylpropionate/trans-cinnamate dioxygenase ferredoxin subunit